MGGRCDDLVWIESAALVCLITHQSLFLLSGQLCFEGAMLFCVLLHSYQRDKRKKKGQYDCNGYKMSA